MLSFMKEQGSKGPSKKSKETNVDRSSTEGVGEQEYIAVDSKKDRARKSTILLTALVLFGLVFLFFMIKKSTPSDASASSISDDEMKIEKAITELTGIRSEMNNRMDEIVKKFYEFSDIEQVEVGELSKNPFQHKLLLVGLNPVSDSQDGEGQAEIIYQQLRQQAEDIELLSIMRSSGRRCCMIDDRILHEGDSVRSFKISQIGDDFVKLVWSQGDKQPSSESKIEDMEIMLTLSD
ncbi:MAG: hypothetical protein ACYTFM_06770 [Planctomycetota bacterium]|jgi:hypothetical protein